MDHAETLVRRSRRHGEIARLGATAITVAVTLAAALTGATLRLTSESLWSADAATDSPAGSSALPAAPPVSVRIPAVDLDTERLVGLGMAPSGVTEVPAEAATVGWLRTGVTPGEAGAAVLVGHRELGYARGAFHAVGELRPGDTVTIARADGTKVTFAVYQLARTSGVPSAVALATAPTGRPELRLLAWAPHSPGERSEARSVVAFAEIASSHPVRACSGASRDRDLVAGACPGGPAQS